MVTGKVNNHLSAFGIVRISKENRESGATPERYRHCKRGGPQKAKAGHWLHCALLTVGNQVRAKCREDPGCAVDAQVRIPAEMVLLPHPASTGVRRLLTQKYGCGSIRAAAFSFSVLFMWFPPYPPYRLPSEKECLRALFPGGRCLFPHFFESKTAAVTLAAAVFVGMVWKKHSIASSLPEPTAAAERPHWFRDF